MAYVLVVVAPGTPGVGVVATTVTPADRPAPELGGRGVGLVNKVAQEPIVTGRGAGGPRREETVDGRQDVHLETVPEDVIDVVGPTLRDVSEVRIGEVLVGAGHDATVPG